MAPKFPNCLKIAQQIGDRRTERVLEEILLREKNAYKCDQKEHNERIEELKSRIEHRHGIIVELKKMERDPLVDECLNDLKAAEKEDFKELGWVVQRSYAAGLRASDKSKIIKKIRKFN